MAHGDYHCCAVCDCKIVYGGSDATTKEMLCASCAVALAREGVFVTDGADLMDWIQYSDTQEVLRILDAVSFKSCHYPNSVDKLVGSLRDAAWLLRLATGG